MLAIDFTEANDLVPREFFEAAIIYLHLPSECINLRISTLAVWMRFCVDWGFGPNVTMFLGSDVRQGDLLSLAFSLPGQVSQLTVSFYANDILLCFKGKGRRVQRLVRSVVAKAGKYAVFSGLTVDYKKSFIAVKRRRGAEVRVFWGLKVKSCVFGNTLVEYIIQVGRCTRQMKSADHISENHAFGTEWKGGHFQAVYTASGSAHGQGAWVNQASRVLI